MIRLKDILIGLECRVRAWFYAPPSVFVLLAVILLPPLLLFIIWLWQA